MEYDQQIILNIINNFRDYCRCIYNYEKYIDEIYKSKHKIEHKGYLIDFEEFEKFKEHINYNIYKKSNKEEYGNSIQLKICELNLKNQPIYSKEIEPFKIKTSEEFLNNLKTKKKYILINSALHEKICKSESRNDYISYYITQSELYFFLDSFMFFHHNKNILDIKSYLYKNNFEINTFF